jgi:uncharacterized protein
LGLLSGLFGGMAGNQGGLRASALLAFDLSPAAYVATSTAVGVMVDAVRMPIYVWSSGRELLPLAWPISVATIGVVVGTVLGERMLFGIPQTIFRKIVAGLIGALGIWLLFRA